AFLKRIRKTTPPPQQQRIEKEKPDFEVINPPKRKAPRRNKILSRTIIIGALFVIFVIIFSFWFWYFNIYSH
ncbi:hypothetical protein ACFLYY_00445, partial [Patescibacteria group bacterium]